MKILFVCQANVGRSQVAMELYRRTGGEAASAGTKVDEPGKTLAERPGAATIVRIMNEEFGIHMIHNVRTQITEHVAAGFDEIIVMAEKETIPNWLLNDERVIFWRVSDPKGQDFPTTRRIVHQIKTRVENLVRELA